MFHRFNGTNPYGQSGGEYGGYGNRGVWSDLKRTFKNGSALIRLLYLNIGFFILIKLVAVILVLFGSGQLFYPTLLSYIGVPGSLENLIYTPWSLITYMFTQFDFLHLLFNMLWLYWFGSLFLNYFSGQKLVGVYLLGGLSGAFLYILSYNLFPYFELLRYNSWAIGASASVMAIVFAVCTYVPHQRIYLFLIGPVQLIYLALFTALIDLLSITSGNAGGHIAHLGGALFGYLFTLSIRRNRDITSGITAILNFFSRTLRPGSKMHVKFRNPQATSDSAKRSSQSKKPSEEKINEILDKISKAGYDSLSKEEKEILFKSGGRNQH